MYGLKMRFQDYIHRDYDKFVEHFCESLNALHLDYRESSQEFKHK